MAGWTFCPIQRTLAIDEGDINIDTGAAVTGYPKANLIDPVHWNQARFTSVAGALSLRFTFGTAPGGANDTDYQINSFGLVNHNLDGATIELRYGSTTVYADATTVTGTPFTLTNASSNPNLLFKFNTAGPNPAAGVTAAVYWWLAASGAPATVTLGQVVWGISFDLGYPFQAEQFDPVPLFEPLVTSGGYEVPTKILDPAMTKVVSFRDPNFTGSTVVYDKTRHATQTYPTYQTLLRAFGNFRLIDLGGSEYTAVAAAGGGLPILYHEGDVNGISPAGRPAHYGYVRPRFIKHDLRGTKTTVAMTIRDALPRGVDIKPADA